MQIEIPLSPSFALDHRWDDATMTSREVLVMSVGETEVAVRGLSEPSPSSSWSGDDSYIRWFERQAAAWLKELWGL